MVYQKPHLLNFVWLYLRYQLVNLFRAFHKFHLDNLFKVYCRSPLKNRKQHNKMLIKFNTPKATLFKIHLIKAFLEQGSLVRAILVFKPLLTLMGCKSQWPSPFNLTLNILHQ